MHESQLERMLLEEEVRRIRTDGPKGGQNQFSLQMDS